MKKFFAYSSLLLLATGCLKDPDYDQLTLNPVVVTNGDKDADFTEYNTFHISDTVRLLSDIAGDTILTDANAKQLVDKVKEEMTALGYTFVQRNAGPDLGLTIVTAKNLNVETVYYPGWGWGWWYWGYWGWYYPPYYPYSYTYAYSTGLTAISAADLKNAGRDQKLTIVWEAILGGYIDTNVGGNIDDALRGIEQAFAQSQYLKTN